MNNSMKALSIASLLMVGGIAHADSYTDTVSVFKHAGESREYFGNSYAYAVFPTVGQAGLVVGGAHGKGRVYVHGDLVGDTSVTQLSAGFQAGGKAYSQIIFFRDKRAVDEFESGKFEFAANASATAITASVDASAGTSGVGTDASATPHHATTMGSYTDGMAVFTVAKGGLMYAATISGQKFSYAPRGAG